jgi:uncharacterized protein YlxP (DUF503 family)
MPIGILNIILYIYDSHSLKERRMVLNGLKAKVRNHFNISVTETDDAYKWQKASLSIVNVGHNRQEVNSLLSKIVNFIEHSKDINIIDYTIEII